MAKKNMMGSAVGSMDMDWKAEQDLRCLLEAEEIREDGKRMNAVRALAKDKLQDLAEISVMPNEKSESNDKD